MSTFIWNSITSTFDSKEACNQFINTAIEDMKFLSATDQYPDIDIGIQINNEDGHSIEFSFNGIDTIEDAASNSESLLHPIFSALNSIDGNYTITEDWMDDNSVGKIIYSGSAPLQKYTGDWILSIDCDSPDTIEEFREFLQMELPVAHDDVVFTDEQINFLIKSVNRHEQAYIVDSNFPRELELLGQLYIQPPQTNENIITTKKAMTK